MKMRKQRYTRLFVDNIVFVAILFLSIILLSSVHYFRYKNGNDILIGDYSFFNLRISNEINENRIIPRYDELSYGGRPFTYLLGWPIMLVATSKITGLDLKLSSVLLPIILGFLTVLILGILISKFTKDKRIKNLVLLIFVLSPPFLYLFSASNSFAAVLFLSLIGFYFLLKDKIIFWALSSIAFATISFFSFFATIFLYLVLLIYILMKNRAKIKWFIISFFIVLAIFIYDYYILYIKFGLPEIIKFKFIESTINFGFQIFFSELGGKFGLSIFSIFLSMIGIYVLWRQKYRYFIVYFSILLLIFISPYFNFLLFYLNLVVAILAGMGLLNLIDRKWESNFIKVFSILVLVFGLIFSGLSFINQMSLIEPTKRQIDAMNYLKTKSNPNDVIFSYYDKGFWFNYIGRKNVMDANFFYAPLVNERWQDSLDILNSKDIDNTLSLLNKYDVDYIWIDESVRNKFYGKKEINFLYQLRYDPRFKLIYRNLEVEIWRYTRQI